MAKANFTSEDLALLLTFADAEKLGQEPKERNLTVQRYTLATLAGLASFGTSAHVPTHRRGGDQKADQCVMRPPLRIQRNTSTRSESWAQSSCCCRSLSSWKAPCPWTAMCCPACSKPLTTS